MRAQLEKIIPPPDASFLAETRERPRFDGIWHFHPEVEIVLIEKGRGERVVGDNISSFMPGDLVLLGSNLPHFWRSEPDTEEKQNAFSRQIIVQFLPTFLGTGFLEAPEFQRLRELLQNAHRGLWFSGEVVTSVTRALRDLAKSEGWRRIALLLEVLGLLSEDSSAAQLSSPEFSPQLNYKAGDRIGRAMNFIFKNASRSISLAEVAAEASMAPTAFCSYFRKITGRHLSKFINDVRLANACALLRNTDREISAICFESGFGTVSNFNRLFREEKGMTPREYRVKIR